MPKITYVGPDSYSGYDGKELVNLDAGQSAEVSAEKVEQLQRDRPGDFELGGGKPSRRGAGSAK